jgi:phosphoribosyl 1,2-cyclic phosphate phosphodiesterase
LIDRDARQADARVVFLGTGTSHGVPMIGCACAVCTSTDPRDKRLRPSVYVDVADRAKILIDTTPDLRQQALTHRITRVDAILFTHGHACYANGVAWETIRRTFYYVFDGKPRLGGGVPQLEPHEIDGPATIGGVRVVPVPLWHGHMPILGFRLGTFAYLTDCNRLADESWPLIEGVHTLVIDALRDKPHTTHFTVAEALEVIARVKPERAFMTHMTHDLGHAATNARLPPGVELAYDGLVLDVRVDVE